MFHVLFMCCNFLYDAGIINYTTGVVNKAWFAYSSGAPSVNWLYPFLVLCLMYLPYMSLLIWFSFSCSTPFSVWLCCFFIHQYFIKHQIRNQHYEVKLFYLSYYGIKINVFTICQSYYIWKKFFFLD
jgi:hypothetical protein